MATTMADSKSTDYYDSNDPKITDDMRAILTQYSGIPEEEQVSHIKAIRGKGWEVFQWPCLGLYSFLSLGIARLPRYPELLDRVNSGDTLLDLGCCFGQDLRKLVFDGADARQLTGSELQPEFIDLGYELFHDRSKLQATFKAGDFFAPETAGLDERSFDIVHAANFYHIFSWAEQVEAWSKTVRLLKPKPGSIIIGRQTGTERAGAVKFAAARSGELYRHNVESFERLISEVAATTGTKLHADIADVGDSKSKVGGGWKILRFCITLQ